MSVSRRMSQHEGSMEGEGSRRSVEVIRKRRLEEEVTSLEEVMRLREENLRYKKFVGELREKVGYLSSVW